MKSFFKTLYGKITLIFFLLLFLLGTAQIIISVQSSMNFVCETDQTLNRYLARNLATKFQPFLQDSLNRAGIDQIINELMIFNPRIEIYLTDEQGDLLAYFADPNKIKNTRIDTAPIKKFLSNDPGVRLPIMGDDPRSDRKKVFSAAEIALPGGQNGYIYVILGSELYDTAINGIGGSYILSTTAFSLGLMLIFAGILGSILFFNLTRRLRRMTSAVKDFDKGDYSRRITIQTDDEMGQLSKAFNHMADTVEQSIEEMKKNDALRRELIANVSHDLRSPLASIQGYLETIIMKDDSMDPEQRRSFLNTILNSVTGLNQLVHELFELSKLDAMQTQPRPEPFSVAELLQDVVLKFQPQAEAKGIHLITKLPRSMPLVVGDIGMIDRVISNLTDNAIRYTPHGGKVTIVLDKRDGRVWISVKDSGEGIPREDLPHIFDRFYRVEKSRSKNSGGSGLGLAIVKKILDAHKVSINVQSEPGRGTVFSFCLKIHTRDHHTASGISMENR
ncbi:MAG: sensor histidine kinase [Calditrichaeota bacterium]|nr:MAG: sensor histidine kinase [Calditrichota bacterium]